MNLNDERTPSLKQFSAPVAWTKLQEPEFIKTQQLGQPDRRTDCAINSLAFVGAMDRHIAENTAKVLNDRKCGITSTQIANYFECGYERMPHSTVILRNITDVNAIYAGLKEKNVALIGINRLSGIGHSATVIRLGGELMVFDAQLETLTPSISNWLNSENASSVEVLLQLDKRVHCRDETTVELRKRQDHKTCTKWRRTVESKWNLENFQKCRLRKLNAAKIRFRNEVETAGFNYEMICRM